MNATAFRSKVEKALESLPASVKDKDLLVPERKLQALIHLNTQIHPELEKNTGLLLDILLMKDGPEKLQCAMLWNLAVSQTSVDSMRAIIKSMDDYLMRVES